MKLFVTGAAGYIGSTFTYEALKKGYKIIGCDNFSNSSNFFIKRIKKFSPDNFFFYDIDLRHGTKIDEILKFHEVDAVVHFAALKSVPNSEKFPDLYIENNVHGMKNLLDACTNHNITKFLFSSSASVYGNPINQPIKEEELPKPISVYGETKLECEQMLQSWSKEKRKGISLRYFNPIGSHKDKVCFEDIITSKGNLMPAILLTAFRKQDHLKIFGSNYETEDGTGERDYIHISDLVEGHFSALNYFNNLNEYDVFNLGLGESVSVLELVKIFQNVNKINIPTKFFDRREGDLDICYADPSKSNKLLLWRAKKGYSEMCLDAYNGTLNNYELLQNFISKIKC